MRGELNMFSLDAPSSCNTYLFTTVGKRLSRTNRASQLLSHQHHVRNVNRSKLLKNSAFLALLIALWLQMLFLDRRAINRNPLGFRMNFQNLANSTFAVFSTTNDFDYIALLRIV